MWLTAIFLRAKQIIYTSKLYTLPFKRLGWLDLVASLKKLKKSLVLTKLHLFD